MGSNTTTTNTQNQPGTAPFSSTVSPAASVQQAGGAALGQAMSIYNMSAPYANTGDPGLGIPAGSPYTSVPNTWVNQGINNNLGVTNALSNWQLPNAAEIVNNESYNPGTAGSSLTPYWVSMARYLNPISSTTQGYLNQANDIYGSANDYNTPIGNLQPLAANTSGALTDVQQQILNDNAERLGNRLASQYSGAGRYGSFGAGIGLARGISETNNPLIASFNQQNIQNALNANQLYGGLLGGRGQLQTGATGLGSSIYNQAQSRAQDYGRMLPGFAQLAMLPGQVQQEAGNYMLNYPWAQLSNATRAIQGLAPTLGSTTSGVQPFNMGSNTQTFQPTPWTTYAGLGLAGLGALFPSDRRIKKDIRKVGRDPLTGLNMYKYRYKGEPWDKPKHFGPMAQEVAEKFPDKVADVGGVLHIQAA